MGLSYRNVPILSIAAIGTLLGPETMMGRSPLTNAFLLPPGGSVPLRGRTAKTRGEALHAIDRETDQTSPSKQTSCKYDLGLGKNAPVVPSKVSRIGNSNSNANANNNIDDDYNDKETDNGVGLPTERTIGCSTPYEATRFLVEHEAVSTYPAPDSIQEASVVGGPLSTNPNEATTTTTTLTSSMESESTIDRNAPKHHKSKPTTTNGATTSISTITTTTTTTTTTKGAQPNDTTTAARATKSQSKLQTRRPVAKVQPKRSLEDCLTILDHHHHYASSTPSNGTATATTTTATATGTHTHHAPSTIVSMPNTPQLDMNSIWVEMLLHNQIAQSRIQA
eukprot:CAMPEP_0172392954 /NCGR_PEP_ID=MMETSP1061-20121228/8937_1 /TAXON_ID=37318 /ORGANISM="Pseudo-nitzschia pungens, Strain cf. pungens" /LENGTH=336 /DNA_ID=CAMNT_0013123897 /DNA_START=29 /DNA_END=1039 /DNA_ORIENTATION=-